jgi:hypothetical protein
MQHHRQTGETGRGKDGVNSNCVSSHNGRFFGGALTLSVTAARCPAAAFVYPQGSKAPPSVRSSFGVRLLICVVPNSEMRRYEVHSAIMMEWRAGLH